MKNKIQIVLLCAFMLVGCGSRDDSKKNKETQALVSGDYNAELPLITSDSRNMHGSKRAGSMFDSFEIGHGLYERSKDHFSSDNYIQSEGSVLDLKEIQRLVGRQKIKTDKDDNSPTNDIGLNPKLGTKFDNGEGVMIDSPMIVEEIYEIDFKKAKDELAGISVAIVLQSQQREEAKSEAGVAYEKITKIEKETLKLYGQEAARKLVSYLRQQPQVGDAMPIYVTLFDVSSPDTTLPGSFISQAYFTSHSRSSKFEDIEEEWVLFPSDRGDQIDSVTATHFDTMRKSLYMFLPEDVSLIGKALYIDKKIDTLYINVSIQAKTYTECQGLIQYTGSLIDNFNDQGMEVKINFLNGNETIAVMTRNKNSSKINLTMLI
ncbi:MAG: CamS family sex pheromone protein [Erysipelotrichaceae bacterium]